MGCSLAHVGLQGEEEAPRADLRGRVEQRVSVLAKEAQVELTHGREVDGRRWLRVLKDRLQERHGPAALRVRGALAPRGRVEVAGVVHRADIQRLERIVQRHGGRGAWAGADDERSLGGRCPSESRQLELRQRPCTAGLLGRAARAVGVARARGLCESEGGDSQGNHPVRRSSTGRAVLGSLCGPRSSRSARS